MPDLVLSPALSAVGVSLTLMAIVADLKIVYKHIINPEGRLACSCREITRPFTPSAERLLSLLYQSWHLVN